MITIFYSWQADRPNRVNRGFIEDALKKAIKIIEAGGTDDLALEDSPRESIELTSDTKGVPGTPHIAATILAKIDAADILVADLTSVAIRADGKRLCPNPNVMLEYGYALRAMGGTERIVTVINTAYGGFEDLPFDLKHYRHRCVYEFTDEATEKAPAVNALAKTLAAEIKQIIDAKPAAPAVIMPEFVPQVSSYKLSRFLPQGHAVYDETDWDSKPQHNYFLDGDDMFLRLYPAFNNGFEANEVALLKCLKGKPEKTMMLNGEISGHGEINEYGYAFIEYSRGDAYRTRGLVQIFHTGELWAAHSNMLRSHKNSPYPIPLFEDNYIKALETYRKTLTELGVTGPFKWVAGMTGTKNRKLRMPPFPPTSRVQWDRIDGQEQGKCSKPEIIYSGDLNANDDVTEKLQPFFEKVWSSCGLDRETKLADMNEAIRTGLAGGR